jgi:DNA-directed RNA polymerase
MSRSIRGAADDLFSGDVLEGTRREFEAFTGLSFPNPPTQGSLDVSGILDAEYFFA